MRMKRNLDIRMDVKNANVKLWDVGEKIGISDVAMSRLLRHELPDEKKEEIRSAIRSLKEEEK